MSLFRKTVLQGSHSGNQRSIRGNIVRALSLSVILLGTFLVTSKAHAAWPDDWTMPWLTGPGGSEVGIQDDETDTTILRDVYSVATELSQRDHEILTDLIEFALQEGISLDAIIVDYVEFLKRPAPTDQRSGTGRQSRSLGRTRGSPMRSVPQRSGPFLPPPSKPKR